MTDRHEQTLLKPFCIYLVGLLTLSLSLSLFLKVLLNLTLFQVHKLHIITSPLPPPALHSSLPLFSSLPVAQLVWIHGFGSQSKCQGLLSRENTEQSQTKKRKKGNSSREPFSVSCDSVRRDLRHCCLHLIWTHTALFQGSEKGQTRALCFLYQLVFFSL